ncbi:MAG: hypothetical protein K0R25_973 [Rickettsiaceae bacterium]|jgi:hypothetical protein|nr:hypothetical protein [Rickettsiaceae bacterium]
MKDNQFKIEQNDFEQLHEVAKKLPEALLNNPSQLDTNLLLSKIFVSRPYFAFDKIYQFQDILISPVKVEQPVIFESTPMSSAEASRHMAILGSCALAANKEEKQYYLAVKARKRAGVDTPEQNIFRKSEQLYVLAKACSYAEKEASALTCLVTLSGEIIFDFKVGYQLFSEKLFDRVFKKHTKPTQDLELSPYREAFEYKDIRIGNNILSAILPKMKPYQCAGHFKNCPILPVGVLAYMTINTLGKFLNNITQDENLVYYLDSADMDVKAPTFIDEEAKLSIFYKKCENNKYYFSWVMSNFSGDENLNTMEIVFAASHKIVPFSSLQRISKIHLELEQYKKMYAELAHKYFYGGISNDKIFLHQKAPDKASISSNHLIS